MKTTKLLIAVIIFFAGMGSINAQEKKLIGGNSLNVIIPQGTLANRYDHGVGIYANYDYNFNEHFAARFDLGWNDISGPETSYVDNNGNIHSDHPNMSVWEFSAGLKAQISVFYVEARGGYFTGVNSWGYTPAVGLRFKKIDLQGNYTFAGDNEWASVRIAYYWSQK